MTPTLTELEKTKIAQCRQNHSGQVGHLLDIIDRLIARIAELEARDPDIAIAFLTTRVAELEAEVERLRNIPIAVLTTGRG